MRRQIALPDLLDQGLLLYRRNWTQLLLFGASVMLPVTLIVVGLSALVGRSSRWDFPTGWLLLGGAAIVALLAYLLVGLARAAWACLLGQPLTLRAMFVLPPGRTVRLVLYALFDWGGLFMGAVVLVTLLSMVELLFTLLLLRAMQLPPSGSPTSAAQLALAALSLGLNGLQIWLALSVPTAMTLYRLQSRLDWLERSQYRLPTLPLFSSALAAGAGMLMLGAALLNIVAVLALLRALLGLDDRLFATLGLAAAVLGAVVLLPLPALWAALLHQHNRQILMGDDLDARVRGWLAATLPDHVPGAAPAAPASVPPVAR